MSVAMSLVVFICMLFTYSIETKAASYSEANWTVAAYNPGNVQRTSVVNLYITSETYAWNVSSVSGGNYSYIYLKGVNCNVNMKSATNRFSAVGKKNFTVSSVNTGSTYVRLSVNLVYESYVTLYTGTLKIGN